MRRAFYLAEIAGVALIFASCTTSRSVHKETFETAAMGHTVPSQLESYAGNIDFDYVVNFAPGEFDAATVMKISPRMQYGNKVVELEPIYFQGEDINNTNYTVIPKDKTTTYSKPMHINYRPGMEKGELWAEIETNNGKRRTMLDPVPINTKGVNVWQQQPLVINGVTYVPIMVQHILDTAPFQNAGCIGCSINFPIAESGISKHEQNNETMRKAETFIKKIMADKNAQIAKVVIVVSSSPDGTMAGNSRLTRARFAAARQCFMHDLNLSNCKGSTSASFLTSTVINENWNGLYELLESSSLKNKTQIVNTLKSIPNSDRRSEKLHEYTEQYPEIKNVMLPSLRKADCYVFYTTPEYHGEQITYVPQIETVMNMEPWGNWQALNDLAVIAIQNKQYRKAHKLLEHAITMQNNNAILYNNLGIACANLQDTVHAIEAFNRAQMTKEAKYNMGVLLMAAGDHKKAIPYLKANPDCLLGYCYLKTGDNAEALRTLKAANKRNAGDYYLLAVAAARCKDTPTMTAALKNAAKQDSDMKTRACHDSEFYTYRQMPEFNSAIN